MPETQVRAGQEQFKYYPYSGIFHATRNSFWLAGQDSFTQPPAQNPDLFTILNNTEPVVQGTLQRRRGYTLFENTLTPANPYQRSYAFRSDGLGLRRYVWTAIANVDATDEAGNVVLSPVFTPTSGAPFVPRMVLSRDYGYFTDGLVADSKKWNGTTSALNLTNWGIVAGAGVAANNYSNYTGSVVNSGVVLWTNPANAQGPPDAAFATVTLNDALHNNNLLQASNYGFSIPSTAGAIVGIQVTIKGLQTVPTSNINGIAVSLVKAGGGFGGTYASVNLPTANGFVVLGGPNNTNGTSWLNTDINGAGFGVTIQAFNSNNTPVTFSIDSIQVTIFTAGTGLLFTTNTTTTNVVLLSGRAYFYAFANSVTGHVSSFSVPSATTGPLPGNQINITGIPTSSDPQVDTVFLLATADGNDQTTLYLLASLPNGTATFNDTISDPVLQTRPLYQNTDINGNLHGIANNNPPPPGLNFPTKHKGRLYGAVGRALYFSKNLDEVTTAGGLITSKWEESWPAINQFDISENAETIQGLLSDGETLWIGTERGIRRLVGDSPANFQKPEIQFNEVGLFNQDSWKVVFYEGQPVGTIWLTPDFRVMASDFNTYQDIGMPIQDVLNGIQSTGPNTTVHASFVSQGPVDLYMLYLPIHSNNGIPDTVCVYNLRTKLWSIWNPTDKISTSLFNISAQGTPQWLFATSNGPTYTWTQGATQDRIGNTPVSYSVTLQSSWLTFGDETLLKALNQMIVYSQDTNLQLTIEGATTQAQLLTAPVVLLSNTTVRTGPLGGWLFQPLAGLATKYYWYRFTWTSPASAVSTILGGFNVETIPVIRV